MSLRSTLFPAVGAVALIVLLLLLILREPRQKLAPVERAAADVESHSSGSEVPREVEPERAAVAVAGREGAGPTQATTPRGDTARVLGRCRAVESGRALGGVLVECTSLGAPQRIPLAAPFTTGGDGRFELEVQAGGSVRLVAQAPGRSPRVAHWRPLPAGATVDLGDVSLAAGFVVQGQVREPDGAPVAGVSVVLSAIFTGIDTGGDDVPASMSGRTDASGAFRIEGDVPAGDFPLGTTTRGWRLISPARVRVDPLAGAQPVAIVAERLPSIAGHVVDTDGVAVEGVHLGLAAGLLPSPSVRTDAAGAFELFARGDDRAPAQVTVRDPGPCEPPELPLPAFEWGTRDARIVLRRAVAIELEVVERESGAAVIEYAVACFPKGANSSLQHRPRFGGTHPEGRVRMQGIRRGESWLQVRPARADLLPNDWILFEARDGHAPMRVELERMRGVRVRVVTSAGDPVAGSRVTLHRREPDDPYSGVRVVHLVPTGESALHDGGAVLPQVSAATTDALGLASLPFPAQVASCVLRVTGAEHLEALVREPATNAEGVVEVVVARGARIEGRFVVRGYGEQALALQFARDSDVMSSEILAMLAPDGSFRSPPLEPGEFTIHLSVPAPIAAGFGMRAPLDPPVWRVTLRDGEVLRLDLDDGAWDAGVLYGRAVLGGAEPRAGQLLLQLVLPNLRPAFGPHALAPDGSFELGGLPPGRWGALLFAGGPDYLQTAQVFDLPGGARREVTFEFSERGRILRLLHSDGATPLGGRSIVISPRHGDPFLATADAQGRVRLEPSLSGEVEILLEGRPESYRVLLPEPGLEHALDVVLQVEP